MSYILDALTKAAQQRDRQMPVVQRLLSPAPRPRAHWSNVSRRLLVAFAVNAVLLAAVLLWWLRPAPVTVPSEPMTAATESVAPPTAAPASPRPLVKLEPLSTAETKVDKPIAPRTGRDAMTARPATSATSPATPPVTPPEPARPRMGTPTLQATPRPAPVSVPRAPIPPEAAGLKLEALIYADTPAERMVFINGRRYREGDSIDGRLRVEEIREEGVDLSDQGRRFTLRVAR